MNPSHYFEPSNVGHSVKKAHYVKISVSHLPAQVRYREIMQSSREDMLNCCIRHRFLRPSGHGFRVVCSYHRLAHPDEPVA